MNVAIIGNGNVGRALAKALRRGGHQVTFGVRVPDPSQPDQASVAAAVEPADATILAIPFAAAAEVIAAGSGFAGMVLIDATNPLGMGEDGLGLMMGHSTSGAEHIAALAPQAHVFKAFNQTGFENIADARLYENRPVMFVAGDNPAGKQTVLTLVADCDFNPVDAGGLRAARILEPLGMLWIELARKRGHGPDFTFTLQQGLIHNESQGYEFCRAEASQADSGCHLQPCSFDHDGLAGRLLVERTDTPILRADGAWLRGRNIQSQRRKMRGGRDERPTRRLWLLVLRPHQHGFHCDAGIDVADREHQAGLGA